MNELSLEDALGPDPSNVPRLNTNPQPGPLPGQPGHQGPCPGQSGPPGHPGNPGPWPGQPGNPGPWPGQPGNPGPWPGQPGNPGPWPGQPGNPGPWPGQSGPPGNPGNMGPWPVQPGNPGPTARALNVPYDIPLQGGWTPFKMLTVEATIKMNVDKFVIDVYSGQDIVFHFNVRFKEGGCGQAIIRNKRVKNFWGAEERTIRYFPFKKGEKFELLMLGEQNQYKVAVNKEHLIEFKHGLKNLNEVTKVNIYGDIILHKVAMM